jgi:oxygen-independent coproporphyrinogen-3 oxidase
MKRGIILLLNNIAIRFNKKDFEYDVYSLVKAFYPQAQITMFYEGEEEAEGEYGMFLLVAYGSQEICLAVERDGTEIFRQQVAVEYEKDRPETKNVLKRLVYGALCQVTGRTLPWGDLTGIRPTKIPMKLLEEGWKNTEIARYMRETYGVSNEKTALAITIANREKALLRDLDYENGYSLYVGIPFCPSICLYCSFSSYPLERWRKYVEDVSGCTGKGNPGCFRDDEKPEAGYGLYRRGNTDHTGAGSASETSWRDHRNIFPVRSWKNLRLRQEDRTV